MKNTKKTLSTSIALAIALFASTRTSAMFNANQPQTQTGQPKAFGNFGNQPQPQATTSTFGSIPNKPQPQIQTGQPKAFSGFGNQPQPQATTSTFGSMPSQPVSPLLQVYFTPQDQIKITNTLFDLLDNAKKQIYIAIYWITDNAIIEKIIAAKRRNIDVQIVIDETTPQVDDIITQLLQNDIVPIICPSKPPYNTGIMHNKFVVIDATKVFTGSANFTQAALNSSAEKNNFENVMIINSTDIAQKFIDAFVKMKQEIFDFYVGIIALNTPNQLPDWMRRLIPIVYHKQNLMKQSVNQPATNYNAEEQRRINNYFGIQSNVRQNHITDKQQRLLNTKGFSNKEISNLSKKEASDLIGTILADFSWQRATEKQRSLLKNKGFSDQEVLHLSKEEASELISDVLNTGMQQQYRW
jgi:hypothetical protein